MLIKTKDDLQKIKVNYQDRVLRRSSDQGTSNRIDVLVGLGTCGSAAGAQVVYETLLREVAMLSDASIKVFPVGCMGYCHSEPTVVVCMANQKPVIYGRVDEGIAKQIVESHIQNKVIVESHCMAMEFDRHLKGDNHATTK